VTTTDASGANPIVWVVSAEGSNHLLGFNGDTGAPVFTGGGISVDDGACMFDTGYGCGALHWTSPIVVNGRIFVGANDKLYAFKGM
jgi:hypothetical protein